MLKNYYFDRLSYEGKYVYRSLIDAIRKEEAQCVVSTRLSPEELLQVSAALAFDNPGFVSFPNLFPQAVPYSNGKISIPLRYSAFDREAYERELNSFVSEIRKGLSPRSSQYTVVKRIYDAIADRTRYDREALNAYQELVRANASESAIASYVEGRSARFTAYGALVDRIAVCDGISKLFKVVCDEFGIECTCVQAIENGGSAPNHLLNVVEVNGVRALVDVTNGLREMTGALSLIGYDYFLVSAATYSTDYTVVDGMDCVSDDMCYHAKNGWVFTSVEGLRKYLCGYTFESTKGEVRCRYDGRVSDKELGDIFGYVLSHHCSSGYRVVGYSVRKGFCIGRIVRE